MSSNLPKYTIREWLAILEHIVSKNENKQQWICESIRKLQSLNLVTDYSDDVCDNLYKEKRNDENRT